MGKKLSVLLLVAVVLFCFYGLKFLRLSVAGEDFVEASFKSYENYSILKKEYPEQSKAIAIIHRLDGQSLNLKNLCDIYNWESSIKSPSNFQKYNAVFSAFDLRGSVWDGTHINLKNYLTNPCESANSEEYLKSVTDLEKSPWNNIITSHDHKDWITQVEFLRDSVTHTPDLNHISELMSSTSALPELNVQWTGSAVFQKMLSDNLEQTSCLNLAVLLVILVFFRGYHGTWRSGLLFLVMITVSFVIVHGGMGWMGHPISTLSMSLFFILSLIILEDFIFASNYMTENLNDPMRSFKVSLWPGMMTSLTTVIGFGSLLISELSAIRQFALWACVAAVIEWILLFHYLPMLISSFPNMVWIKPDKVFLKNFDTSWFEFNIPKAMKYVLAVSIPITLYFAYVTVDNLQIKSNPLDVFSKEHGFTKTRDYILNTRAWEGSVSLLFKPEVSEQEAHQLTQQISESLVGQKLITSVDDFTEIQNWFYKDVPSYLQSSINIDLYSSELYKNYFSNLKYQKVELYIKSIEMTQIQQLETMAVEICDDKCFLSGDLIVFVDAAQPLINTLFYSLFSGFALLIGILTLICLYKKVSLKKVVFISLTSTWGISMLCIIMYLFDIPITIVTCLVISIMAGVAGDNLIQFLYGGETGDLNSGIDRLGSASIYCIGIMILVSLVLLFSSIEDLHNLGVFLGLGFILSLIGDLWILKTLLSWWPDKKDTSLS